jgi:GTP-binding protein
VLDAFGLGLGEPIPVSAEHGEGMADLYAAVAAYAAEFEDDEPDEDAGKPISIAIVGKPNAGKSTLVNRLIGEERLLVGPEAGITRDAIPVDWEWDGQAIRLVDTAGLRRKAKVQEKLEKLSTHDSIRAITFAEVVILVMDATHPFEIQDLQIADLVEREGRSLVFVLAKWDLVEDPHSKMQEFVEEASRVLPQLKGSPVVALSAETGHGLGRLMPAVIKAHTDWSTKVKTRDLNDWLKMAVERHPPPAVGGRRVKPKYMAQTKARPPTFVLFASRADQLPDHYRRYLVNSIRESFDLPGVPIRLSVRSNKNPFAEGEEKSGSGLTRAKPSEAKTGMAARTRRTAAAKAKEGAEGRPKAASKPKKVKAGNPRGRAAKLSRPGVKPKRASRPSSTSKRPR